MSGIRTHDISYFIIQYNITILFSAQKTEKN